MCGSLVCMNKAKGRQSAKKKNYYALQLARTAVNTTRREARVERRKKETPKQA